MATHWALVIFALLAGFSLRAALADVLIMSPNGAISGTATTEGALVYKHGSGLYGVDTSATTNNSGTLTLTGLSTQNVSATALQLTPASLPTCNGSTNGQTRVNSTNQSCYCNGTQWRDTAPSGISILGSNVLLFTACNP